MPALLLLLPLASLAHTTLIIFLFLAPSCPAHPASPSLPVLLCKQWHNPASLHKPPCRSVAGRAGQGSIAPPTQAAVRTTRSPTALPCTSAKGRVTVSSTGLLQASCCSCACCCCRSCLDSKLALREGARLLCRLLGRGVGLREERGGAATGQTAAGGVRSWRTGWGVQLRVTPVLELAGPGCNSGCPPTCALVRRRRMARVLRTRRSRGTYFCGTENSARQRQQQRGSIPSKCKRACVEGSREPGRGAVGPSRWCEFHSRSTR